MYTRCIYTISQNLIEQDWVNPT